MSVLLDQALRSNGLQPGQTYRRKLDGLTVELRVFKEEERTGKSAIPESDIMSDAWVELPSPEPLAVVQGVPGEPQLPDPPAP